MRPDLDGLPFAGIKYMFTMDSPERSEYLTLYHAVRLVETGKYANYNESVLSYERYITQAIKRSSKV